MESNHVPNCYSEPAFDKCGKSLSMSALKELDSFNVEHFICTIANNTWRLQKKLGQQVESATWGRPVAGLLDALSSFGVCIKDHTGEPYDTGMAVNVIAWEPQPKVANEVIIETIKPSIRWNGKLLQWGDVIVCSPDGESNTEAMKGLQP